MKYRINRPDNGSKELIAYAKSLGFDYEHMGGSIEGGHSDTLTATIDR
jgi:hypothetical protein